MENNDDLAMQRFLSRILSDPNVYVDINSSSSKTALQQLQAAAIRSAAAARSMNRQNKQVEEPL